MSASEFIFVALQLQGELADHVPKTSVNAWAGATCGCQGWKTRNPAGCALLWAAAGTGMNPQCLVHAEEPSVPTGSLKLH